MKVSVSDLSARWAEIASLVLSVWVAVSPFVVKLAEDPAFAGNLHAAGLAAAAASVLLIVRPARLSAWIVSATGIWLMASPWLLGFADEQTPTRQTIFYGLALVGLAVMTLHGRGLLSSPRPRILPHG